jgi:hypothetical protein
MRRLAGLLLLGAVVACDKPPADGARPSASASASAAAPSAASTPAPAPASASATPGSSAATRSWRGTYKSTAATLTVPPDYKKTHWSDTQTTAGIGDGTLALTIDGATGHVSGVIDGPLGPATVDGAVTDGKLAATIRRKDPTDQGFAGTVLGSVASDRVEGTMNVSLGLASALRTATFTLTPSGAAP